MSISLPGNYSSLKINAKQHWEEYREVVALYRAAPMLVSSLWALPIASSLDEQAGEALTEGSHQTQSARDLRCWREVAARFLTASRREESISLTARKALLVEIQLSRSTYRGTLHPRWEVRFHFPGSAFQTGALMEDTTLNLDEVLSLLHIQPDEVVWSVREGA